MFSLFTREKAAAPVPQAEEGGTQTVVEIGQAENLRMSKRATIVNRH